MKRLLFLILFCVLASNANAACDDPLTDGVDYTNCRFSDGQDLQGVICKFKTLVCKFYSGKF